MLAYTSIHASRSSTALFNSCLGSQFTLLNVYNAMLASFLSVTAHCSVNILHNLAHFLSPDEHMCLDYLSNHEDHPDSNEHDYHLHHQLEQPHSSSPCEAPPSLHDADFTLSTDDGRCDFSAKATIE